MKKSSCLLLLMIAFSAFAVSPSYCGSCVVKPVVKVAKKKVSRTAYSPLADLALLPALNG